MTYLYSTQIRGMAMPTENESNQGAKSYMNNRLIVGVLSCLLLIHVWVYAQYINTNIAQSNEIHRLQNTVDSLSYENDQLLKIRSLNHVTLTAYNPVEGQTDATPFITANGDSVNEYTIALSRDLLKRYNASAEIQYGDWVWVLTKYRVTDTMNKRYTNSVDLLTYSYNMARIFGRRTGSLVHFEYPVSRMD